MVSKLEHLQSNGKLTKFSNRMGTYPPLIQHFKVKRVSRRYKMIDWYSAIRSDLWINRVGDFITFWSAYDFIRHNVTVTFSIAIDSRHTSLIADYMTHAGGYRPFSRHGLGSCASPLQVNIEFSFAIRTLGTKTSCAEMSQSFRSQKRLCSSCAYEFFSAQELLFPISNIRWEKFESNQGDPIR